MVIWLGVFARAVAFLSLFSGFRNDFEGRVIAAVGASMLWTIATLCERIDERNTRDENDTAL